MRLLVKRGNSEIQIYIYIYNRSILHSKPLRSHGCGLYRVYNSLDRFCFLKRDETSHSLWSFADRDTHAAEFSLDRSFFPSGRQMDLDIYIYGSYNKDELEKRLLLRCETRQLWKTVLRLASRGISIRSILGFRYISSFLVRRIEFVPFTAW